MAIILVARGDDTSELIRRALGIQEIGAYHFSAAVIEAVQAHNYAYEVLPFEASITAETAEKLLNVMALFPIMVYDRGSTKEQRLALIENQFKTDGEYQMPYVVDAVLVGAPTG